MLMNLYPSKVDFCMTNLGTVHFNIKMVNSTSENLNMERNMVWESLQTLMELYFTRANGTKTRHRLKGQSNNQKDLTCMNN